MAKERKTTSRAAPKRAAAAPKRTPAKSAPAAPKRAPAGPKSAPPTPKRRWPGFLALLAILALGAWALVHPGTPQLSQDVEAQAGRLATTVPAVLEARVVAEYPHDPGAFTQGLLVSDGLLYESTGLVGQSSLREVELRTGRVLRMVDVPDVFGEGLARVGDRLFQITWKDGVAYEWDRETFTKRGEFRYQGEGWGLCNDGSSLVMSDGSDTLTFRDPDTFAARRTLRVTKLGRPLRMLNELECVRGSVYANVWQTDEIVRIDATNGRVTGTLDLAGLLPEQARFGADVLNGIAFLPESGHFLLTGKLWPSAFEVELRER